MSNLRSLPLMLLASLLFVMLLAAPARAVMVVDTDHQLSYTLPRGWTSYSAAELAQYNKGGTRWLHGGEGPQGGHFLIMAEPKFSRTGAAGLPLFRRELEAPNCTVESVTWDGRRNAYVAYIALRSGGRVIHILLFAFAGDAERVTFYCYPPQTDLAPVEDDFLALADSVTLNATEAAAAPAVRSRAPWVVLLGVMGGGVCFLVFLIIAGTLLFAILRKRKAANA